MNINKINVLLVDNDSSYRELFSRRIASDPAMNRFNFEMTSTLHDCFRILDEEKTDIVLLDLGLPETRGLETIEKFHQNCPDLPVVVLTSHSDGTFIADSIKKGASSFIEKRNLYPRDLARTILNSIERHEIQQQLKEERQNARDYLDLACVIVVMIDTDQYITMVNKTGCKVLGYQEENLIGKNWFDVFAPSNKNDALKEKFCNVIENNNENQTEFETVIIAADNKHKIISWNTKFVRDNNGNITGILGSGADVTAQKKSKQKLKKINNQIKEHDLQKSEFIINISHELRTPLTIFKNIISNAVAGTSGKISPKLQNELKIGDKAISRLAGIISDFLDISKIEAGKMELNFESIGVRKLIKDAIDMHKPLIDSNYMDIRLLIPNEELIINGDNRKMMQIMGKLIENAAKFVPDVGGEMTVRVTDLQNKIQIDVEDNGPGIEGENINRVFNRFIQVERHVGEGEHGTGLGLAITKELVEMHHGKIWVENKEEGGTIFKMILPKKVTVSTNDEQEMITQIQDSIADLTDQAQQINEICRQPAMPEEDDSDKEKNSSPIDWELALKYCGDEDVIIRIADSILKDSPNLTKMLRKAVKEQNEKDTVYASHKLKGAIALIGTTTLTETAEAIEIAAGENNFDVVREKMPLLEKQYEYLTDFLNKEDWPQIAQTNAPAI